MKKELKSKTIFTKMKDKPLTVRRCKEVLLYYGDDLPIRKKFINELERLVKDEARREFANKFKEKLDKRDEVDRYFIKMINELLKECEA